MQLLEILEEMWPAYDMRDVRWDFVPPPDAPANEDSAEEFRRYNRDVSVQWLNNWVIGVCKPLVRPAVYCAAAYGTCRALGFDMSLADLLPAYLILAYIDGTQHAVRMGHRFMEDLENFTRSTNHKA